MRYIDASQYHPISNTDGIDCNEFLSDSGIGNHRVGMLWLVHTYLDTSLSYKSRHVRTQWQKNGFHCQSIISVMN